MNWKAGRNFISALWIGSMSVAAAHAMSAEEMASHCKEIADAKISNDYVEVPLDYDSGVCWGAFLSFQEAIRYSASSSTIQPVFHICAVGTTLTQLVKVFTHYTEMHPEQLQTSYFQVAVKAGQEAFPCKSTP